MGSRSSHRQPGQAKSSKATHSSLPYTHWCPGSVMGSQVQENQAMGYQIQPWAARSSKDKPWATKSSHGQPGQAKSSKATHFLLALDPLAVRFSHGQPGQGKKSHGLPSPVMGSQVQPWPVTTQASSSCNIQPGLAMAIEGNIQLQPVRASTGRS